MTNRFKSLLWTGSTVFGVVFIIITIIIYGIVEYTSRPNQYILDSRSNKEVKIIHDTVYKEIIKEVPVECKLPHVQPKPQVKEQELQLEVKSAEIKKDTTNLDI